MCNKKLDVKRDPHEQGELDTDVVGTAATGDGGQCETDDALGGREILR